jgi:hypothetical protein
MIAEEAIAASVGCSTRTLRRLMERYREAAKLPEPVRDAMEESGINPIKARNGKIVSNLIQMVAHTPEIDTDEATSLVARAKFVDPRSHYVPLTPEQKVRWQERLAIRKIIQRYPATKRFDAVADALAEELFDVYGITTPTTITITPRPGPFTIDGLIKKETA